MKQFIPKPYKLFNKIQNYDWGTKNDSAFIPNFLGIEPIQDTPYAELWIGAHPKAPSEIEIDGVKIPLNKIIENHPMECLGDYVCRNFSSTFPFLLKVLSAGNALSIQTHPNKLQAGLLHTKDPKNYPDDNHKPEIAIAIDSLDAVAGFQPIQSIKKNLESLPELGELAGQELIDEIVKSNEPSTTENLIKKLYSVIMQRSDEKELLASCIIKIQKRLTESKSRSPEEEQFMEQYKLFGADVGLLSFFFFNLIHLKPGEAIFTDAGIPHAYIKGNIIECMANSDNVIRAGLTNKFKDVETLLNIIRYDFSECPIINAEQKTDEVIYRTTAKEFEVCCFKKSRSIKKKFSSENRPSVYLIMDGALEVRWKTASSKQTQKFSKGESFFLPAALEHYEISSENAAEFFAVRIP